MAFSHAVSLRFVGESAGHSQASGTGAAMTAESPQNTSGKRIVVGVDGSTSSREALRWAQDEAEARGGTVTAVIAWAAGPRAVGAGLPPRIPDISPDTAARHVLETTVSSVYGPRGSTVVEQ